MSIRTAIGLIEAYAASKTDENRAELSDFGLRTFRFLARRPDRIGGRTLSDGEIAEALDGFLSSARLGRAFASKAELRRAIRLPRTGALALDRFEKAAAFCFALATWEAEKAAIMADTARAKAARASAR